MSQKKRRARKARDLWAEFGKILYVKWFNDGEPGDLDGGDVQDIATRIGLLEPEWVTEPCGETCLCACFEEISPKNPTKCNRLTVPFPKVDA